VISSEIREDGITVIRLNRPDRQNALVPELVHELLHHLRAAAATGQPIVLTATGPTFCPGADLKWLSTFRDPVLAVADLVAIFHLAITTMVELPAPIVAALNGTVAGGGFGLALAADIRIAAESATFTMGYFRLGLTPDGGSTTLLPQLIGRGRMLELLLTNRRLPAATALEWGLVNEVVADDTLLDRAVAFARGLPPVLPFALRQTRGLLDTTNLRDQLQRESVAIRTAARGQWLRDALHAFREAHPE
jgi:enoyl-CoA hydratase/carnithine racemase